MAKDASKLYLFISFIQEGCKLTCVPPSLCSLTGGQSWSAFAVRTSRSIKRQTRAVRPDEIFTSTIWKINEGNASITVGPSSPTACKRNFCLTLKGYLFAATEETSSFIVAALGHLQSIVTFTSLWDLLLRVKKRQHNYHYELRKKPITDV